MDFVQAEVSALRKKMEEVLENFKEEIKGFRLGKASAALVENLKIPYYGQEIPLNSLANVSVIDVLNLSVEPYDSGTKADIIQGFKKVDLGANIIEEGDRIRLSFPPISEERKKELIKLLGQKKEEAKVVLRRLREGVWEEIQNKVKDKELPEDDKFRAEKELNDLISEFNQQLEELAEGKEKEINE